MIASIYCQHYKWNLCPTGPASAYKAKEKTPNFVLEGVADRNFWILSMYFGLPGALNDINVLDNCPTMGKILFVCFPLRTKYTINGVTKNLLYFLAEGIYPDYAVFVKTIANGGNSSKDKNFARTQEALRKDEERAFSILIARWSVLERTIKMGHKEYIQYLV